MQGIRRTGFDRILNAFVASDELVYRWRRTRLSLATNAFITSGERVGGHYFTERNGTRGTLGVAPYNVLHAEWWETRLG